MAKKKVKKTSRLNIISTVILHHRLSFLLFFLLILLILVTFEVVFADKFFPRVFVGDTHLMFRTRDGAIRLLDSKFNQRRGILKLTYLEQNFDLDLASAEIRTSDAVNQAFRVGHQGSWNQRLAQQLNLWISKEVFLPDIETYLDYQIEGIAASIKQPPQNATLIIEDQATASAKIKIMEGKNGLELDKKALNKQIKNYLLLGQTPNTLPAKQVEPDLTTDEVKKAQSLLEEIAKDPIKLTFQGQAWTMDPKTLLILLDLTQTKGSIIDKEKLQDYLKDLAKNINQPVKEGQFNFDQAAGRVSEFTPSQEGRELDIEKTASLVNLAFEGERSKTISLPINVIQPKIKTEQVNDLGIKELLGRGISHFAGSIANRIYNIELAASRINGILIPPGEIFSFNEKVGDISAASGYRQAYVIKSGRTVLDDGGGVCQDSTTLFRAVLNAGLPVVARTAHAYRVGYYEQGFSPGLDATVFAPSVDFKFKNDTPFSILIQAYTSGNTLYVDLYGTSDGRVSTLTKPIIHSQTPPLPEIRQDDPTLPKGEVKQVDWPAWGANVSFSRTVTRGGEKIIQETFRSNFRPWQAIFLVGTKEG